MGENPYVDVKAISLDHRTIEPGSLFVAIRGTHFDGHTVLNEVAQKGAVGVVVEDVKSVPTDFSGAVVQVSDTRKASSQLASRYYGNPSDKLFCVGVTGTNGKTSTCYLTEYVLNEMEMATGVMGTVDHHFYSNEKKQNIVWDTGLTTPDPVTLQKRLHEFRTLGAKAVAFEVSSHALHQNRVESVDFDVAVFTNLTRDHLDYHLTMEDYFNAKNLLFKNHLGQKKSTAYAIVNEHDEWAQQITVPDNVKRWGFGEIQTDFQFQILKTDFSGTHFHLHTPRGDIDVHSQLIGRHNVYNTVAAMAVGLAAGAPLEVAKSGVEKFAGVPGRLERVGVGSSSSPDKNSGPFIFIDYAHTDDALKTVLTAIDKVRSQSKSTAKIITVFGCGGDRDKGKRPLMAQAAIENSDIVIVTSDNPRTEAPDKIIQDIIANIPKELLNKKLFVEIDRKAAIRLAIQKANIKDVVLIAGKGHENYQIVGDKKMHFSDHEVTREFLLNKS
jgi:UDP-N-acetylmuramoyl-L-alanyl-D-glutamate--2,6-diaminopimelate ligase